MEKDKILEELFAALRDLTPTHKKLEEMEKESGLSEDEAFDVMMATNEEYLNLEHKRSKLSDKIAGLFIRSKYSLLTGVSYDEKKVTEKLQKAFEPEDKHAEEFLDEMLMLRRDEMIKRWKQLPSLVLTEHLRNYLAV